MLNTILGGALGLAGNTISNMQQQQNTAATVREQYKLNEQAAENAFERQKELIDQQYQRSLPITIRKNLEEAGLNVGLMYAGGISGGGGSGSATAPQGGTTATQAPMLDVSASIKNGLEASIMAATAKKTEAEAKKIESETLSEDQKRAYEKMMQDYFHENERQRGIAQWLENEYTKYKHEDGNERRHRSNEILGTTITFNPKSYTGQNALWELLKKQGQTYEAMGKANEAEAIATLTNEKERWYFTEMLKNLAQGDLYKAEAHAKKIEAKIRERESELETGDDVNWKTYYNIGKDIAELGIEAAGTVARYKIGKGIIEKNKNKKDQLTKDE